jgi:hypothetical protein
VPNKTKNNSCEFCNLSEYYFEGRLDTAVSLLRKDLEEYRDAKEDEDKMVKEKYPRILEQEAIRDIDNNVAKMRELSNMRNSMSKVDISKKLIDIDNSEFITDLAIWLNKQKVNS